jgi:hypothetical protein
MAGNLVTIRTFSSNVEANLARTLLERAGIPAVLTDELTSGDVWRLSSAVAAIKLQVAEEDRERALACLDSDDEPAGSQLSEQESRVESESPPAEEDDEDDEDEPMASDSLKKIGRPLIWCILFPTLFFFAFAAIALICFCVSALLKLLD